MRRIASLAIAAVLVGGFAAPSLAQSSDGPSMSRGQSMMMQGPQAMQGSQMMRGQGMMMPGMMGGGHHRGGAQGMMSGGMPGHGMMMKVMFAIVDADGNGSLSLGEVQAVHARLFAAADADGDGQLTPEEMRGFMGSHRSAR